MSLYELLNDKSLMDWLYEAIEAQDGQAIKEIQQEINKRNTE